MGAVPDPGGGAQAAAAPPPEGAPKFNFYFFIFLTNSVDLLQG